jgi:Flp pilus assembly protein TadG
MLDFLMAQSGKYTISKLMSVLRKNLSNEHGNSAMTFAIALLPLLAGVGLAVDGGRVFMVKSQLSSAVDVTALTATRLYTSPQRDVKSKEFFSANFSADKGRVTLNPINIIASLNGTTKIVEVKASANVPTLFMRLFGINSVTVSESAKAARTDYPIELVMALDNTGSMALDIGGGVSRLAALKTAANNLVDSVYGAKETNPQIQIGIIPYTAYVNVGRLLEAGYIQQLPGYTDRAPTDPLGWKGCVDADASNSDASDDLSSAAWSSAYDTLDMRAGFPVKPSLYPSLAIKYNYNNPTKSWNTAAKSCAGVPDTCQPATINKTTCVEGTCKTKTIPNPNTTCTACVETVASSGSSGPYTSNELRWIHPYHTGGNDALFGRANPTPVGLDLGDPNVSNYQYYVDPAWKAPLPYASKTTDRSSEFEDLVQPTADNHDNATESINDDSNNDGSAASPNTYCPQQALPLTSHSKTDLKNYINGQLKAFFPDWGTLSNQGLLWGWRMVSAEAPLRGQGSGSGFNKAVVLMTDGEMFHPGGRDVNSFYRHDGLRTAYGFGSEKTLVNDANATRPQLVTALYNRLRKTCENMKREGIAVYTVTLDPTMSAASKSIYRSCASGASNYFDTPDAASLKAAFDAIADNLSGVRLVE